MLCKVCKRELVAQADGLCLVTWLMCPQYIEGNAKHTCVCAAKGKVYFSYHAGIHKNGG